MRTQHVVPVAVAVVTLAMFGVVWPMTWQSGVGSQFRMVQQAAASGKDLAELEKTVEGYLEEAEELSRVVKLRRADIELAGVDAFGEDAGSGPKTGGSDRDAQQKLATAALTGMQSAAAQAMGAQTGGTGKDEAGAELRLLGVVFAGKESVVIINWDVFRLGGIVNGMKIVEIGEKEVVLASKVGQRRVLMLEDWKLEETQK